MWSEPHTSDFAGGGPKLKFYAQHSGKLLEGFKQVVVCNIESVRSFWLWMENELNTGGQAGILGRRLGCCPREATGA